jgi:hypothetical protein
MLVPMVHRRRTGGVEDDPSSDGDGQNQCDRRQQQRNNFLHSAHGESLLLSYWPRGASSRGLPSAKLMPMAAPPMAVNATKAEERPEPEEASTEVMMMPPAVPVTMMPEAPTVDLLHH